MIAPLQATECATVLDQRILNTMASMTARYQKIGGGLLAQCEDCKTAYHVRALWQCHRPLGNRCNCLCLCVCVCVCVTVTPQEVCGIASTSYKAFTKQLGEQVLAIHWPCQCIFGRHTLLLLLCVDARRCGGREARHGRVAE